MKLSAKSIFPACGLVLVVLAAYLNHFRNDFHLDDAYTITGNTAVKELRNIPRFFADAKLSSALPAAETWRPLVSTSFAIDYRIAQGAKPLWFHVSTFFWFAVLLIVTWLLFRGVMDRAAPHPSNRWTALAAAACFGLHPANAGTINYITQRAEVYAALGLVAGLFWFARYPAQRKRGWYLIPVLLGCLAQPAALIFPLLLMAYIFLFEDEKRPLRAAAPAFVVTLAAAVVVWVKTPAPPSGAVSPWLSRITQPWVALRYFQSFFLPVGLSAENGWKPVAHAFRPEALAGYLFIALLAAAALRASRARETRPVAFGLIWFLLALLPGFVMPLRNVADDYRMFLPFMGLTLAVVWGVRLVLLGRPEWIRGGVAAAAALLLLAAVGTHARNRAWRTEESLWQDVVRQSPNNVHGLITYAATLMTHGDYVQGLEYLGRAERLQPDDSVVQANMGIALGALRRDQEAARHFERAVALANGRWEPYFYYGRWLKAKGKYDQAEAQLQAAMRGDPLALPPRILLMETYADHGKTAELDALTEDTMRLAPDAAAPSAKGKASAAAAKLSNATPEMLVREATGDCRASRYDDCLANAKQAIELRPNYAEAYNVMAMALIATNHGDDGIEALRQALRIKPDYETAKKNLAWALEEKKRILGHP
jgi:protein O-mannosyl-transferase